MVDELTPEELYARHGSGLLVRESIGFIDPYAFDLAKRRARVVPYGWLRGFLLVLDSPFPNMDASRAYTLAASLSEGADGIARSFRVQQISEAVDGLDPYYAHMGEVPLL